MAKRCALIVAVLFCLSLANAFAEDRFVSIVIDNQSPSITVLPQIEFWPEAPVDFNKPAANKFEYDFKVSDREWFNTANIKVLWKDAYLNTDGTKTDFEQRIQVRLRRDFPPVFRFSIYFSNNRTQGEMTRLEYEGDINQQFEVFFRAWQIANYYRDASGPQHPLTRRAAKLFFFSAAKLAEKPDYFVLMSDEAERFASEAFSGAAEYANRANLARSMYWEDLRRVDRLVAEGKCDVARILLDALRALKDSEAERFAARYPKDSNVLDDKERIITARCRP